MNTLITKHRSPFRELEDLQSRLWNILGASHSSRGNSQDSAQAEWMPLVDIAEDEKEYLITAELPDVQKEDVKVTLENKVLTVSGTRKFEKEQSGRRWHRIERSYGSFSRSFALPEDGDAGQVNAEFKHGVLRLRVAKSEAAKPKQIEVQVA